MIIRVRLVQSRRRKCYMKALPSGSRGKPPLMACSAAFMCFFFRRSIRLFDANPTYGDDEMGWDGTILPLRQFPQSIAAPKRACPTTHVPDWFVLRKWGAKSIMHTRIQSLLPTNLAKSAQQRLLGLNICSKLIGPRANRRKLAAQRRRMQKKRNKSPLDDTGACGRVVEIACRAIGLFPKKLLSSGRTVFRETNTIAAPIAELSETYVRRPWCKSKKSTAKASPHCPDVLDGRFECGHHIPPPRYPDNVPQ